MQDRDVVTKERNDEESSYWRYMRNDEVTNVSVEKAYTKHDRQGI